MKSGGFHEIRWINPADFMMKSGGFHEIMQISCEIGWISL